MDQAATSKHLSRTPVRLMPLLRLLWGRKLLLAGFVMVFAVASALYAVTRKPVYESVALLAGVKDENLQLGGGVSGIIGQVAGLAGLNLGATSVNESVAVLQSRDFALRFMRTHGVDRYMFPSLWDDKTQSWRPRSRSGLLPLLAGLGIPVEPDTATPAPGPLPDDAVRGFDRLRAVSVDRRTEFVKLAVKGPTPEVARDWARA
ncbi:MAG TPA: Wzz/FepE/Etk N-terminal domain-containing protein, partial [Steroidobacteraceae bacterium]|nr:Wzz/FepE/Etk N-terminal domain-containing protein [Steroidobacteraceae bacterium]